MSWAEKDVDWKELANSIQAEINVSKYWLQTEKAQWIQHYFDHGEYAIAFEFLFLELIENNKILYSMNARRAKEIGLILDLDKEQQYDENFWTKFLSFLSCHLQ